MSGIRDAIQRMKARFSRRLADSPLLSEVLGHVLIARARLPWTSDATRLEALLAACRRTNLSRSRAVIERQLAPYLVGPRCDVAREQKVGWGRFYGDFGQIGRKQRLKSSLVLKASRSTGEKGVLYCSYEYNWMQLLAHHDARAILNDYYLFCATSWSPTNYASLAAFAGLSSDPIFIGVSNFADMERLALMRPVAEPVPILASDWINPDDFVPKPRAARTIDILMVADWKPWKRHWLLFEALRDMRHDLRVVLVGRNAAGRTENEIRAEAKAFGAKQKIEIHTNLEIYEVAQLQCDARISAIFSRREGSCVAATESLFADTPVAMMAEAHIGSKAYINPQTGVLLVRRGLARSLERFLDESDRFSARKWAIENISCTKTSARLNTMLRNWAQKTGRPFTEDIAELCWRYVPGYSHPEDEARLAPEVALLNHTYGLEFEKFPGERASLQRPRWRYA